MRFTSSAFAALATYSLVDCVSAQSLGSALSDSPSLSTLANLLGQYPDLIETLSGASDITILAPTNDALAQLPEGLSEDFVRAVLTYHVLNGEFPSDAFSSEKAFAHTFLTDENYANVTGGQVVAAQTNEDGGVMINDDVMVENADISFDGGVIHTISSVLIPPENLTTVLSSKAGDVNLTTTLSVLSNFTDIVATLLAASDITLFLPNNDAWEGVDISALNEEQIATVLSYHAVQGSPVAYSTNITSANFTTVAGENVEVTVSESGVMVNSANVVRADILTANGVVHVIDGVLMPPSLSSGSDEDVEEDEDQDGETIDSPATTIKSSAISVVAAAMIVAAALY